MLPTQAPYGYPQPYGVPQAGVPQAGYGYQPPIQGYSQPLGYGGYASPHAKLGLFKGKATTAFTVSIVGFFIAGMILGIVAIVNANSALSGMKRSGDNEGKGLAVAAIVIGIIDIVGWVYIMSRI